MTSPDSSASSSEALSLGLSSPISPSNSSVSYTAKNVHAHHGKPFQNSNNTSFAGGHDAIHLSLPESFDDSLSFFGMGGAAAISKNGTSRCTSFVSDQNTDLLVQFASTKKNFKDVQGKLKRRDERITALTACLNERKQSIRDIVVSDEKYEYLKQRSEKDLGLVDFASVIFYEKMSKLQKANDSLQQKCQELSQNHFNDLERTNRSLRDATTAKIAAEEREEVVKADLMKAEALYKDAKLKVSDLQSNILELQEKGRRFDDVSRKHQTGETELINLRRLVEDTEDSTRKLVLKDAKNREKLLNAEKKIEVLEMDKSFLRKELTTVKDRASQGEKEVKKLEIALHEVTVRKDTLMLQLNEGREKIKADYHLKLETETVNLKLHSNKEINEAFEKASDKWRTEVEQMREVKNKAKQELDTVQNHLLECKSVNDDLNTRLSAFEVRRENQLKESRNEIMSKELENVKLATTNQTFRTNLRKATLQNEYLRDQIIVHQQNFCNLEVDSRNECNNLSKQLADLSEQLNPQMEAEYEYNGVLDSVEYVNGVPDKRSTELLRKCVMTNKKKEELYASVLKYKRENAQIQHRMEATEKLFQRLSKSSRPLAESFRKQEEEMSKLKQDMRLLQSDLTYISSQRDQLKSTLSKLLDQRKELLDIKKIIQSPSKIFFKQERPKSTGQNNEQVPKKSDYSFRRHLLHKDQRIASYPKEAWHSPCP